MSIRRIAYGLMGLTMGGAIACAASPIGLGEYELWSGEPGEEASLTVMEDLVILEYEDEDGSAYVEYKVVDRGCRVPP